jgi:lipopolysaccharide transport system ATP-binding protein
VAALLELGAGLQPDFSGRENVFLRGALLGLSRDEIESRFDSIAAFADIGDFMEQPAKTYSSGMLLRLGFAVSVGISPDILVVDEALAVGDMGFQQKCLQCLADLKASGTTILLVSHDIMLTRNYCDRVVYLDGGKVKAIGEAESVGEAYIHDMFSRQQEGAQDAAIEWRPGIGKLGFGSAGGRIVSVRLEGVGTGSVFTPGGIARIAVAAEVRAGVGNPQVVVQIRDSRGYVLYGLSSMPGIVGRCDETEMRRVSAVLEFDISLAAGEYAVTIGLNDRHSDALVTLLDKVVAACRFSVTAQSRQAFHGCIDLNGRWVQENATVSGRALPPVYGDHDIGDRQLAKAIAESANPAVLAELAAISRQHFSWFNRRSTRSDEYVWVVQQLAALQGGLIVDVGAGVSPLPIYIARLGHEVLTIDGSSTRRVPGEGQLSWDGWGYLDYGLIERGIASMNANAIAVQLEPGSVSACVSVSVVEHMPGAGRRTLFGKFRDWLAAGGRLLLTIDLVPGTEDLWNLDQGQVVESRDTHGTLADLIRELENAGFAIRESAVRRGYTDAPKTDLALVHAVRL